jgi:5-methylcytosine-specific restriction protein A
MVDRRSFSQKKRAEICLRQGGKCGCGEKLQLGQYEIDHIQALVHDGDNEDDNLRAICRDCHKAKTRKDVQGRAHHDRIAVGGKQRKGPPMPGSRASGLKKHMDGSVSRRE